jgi:hypothetical protein
MNFQVERRITNRLLIDLLYELPRELYTIEDIEKEVNLFVHLYQAGF